MKNGTIVPKQSVIDGADGKTVEKENVAAAQDSNALEINYDNLEEGFEDLGFTIGKKHFLKDITQFKKT